MAKKQPQSKDSNIAPSKDTNSKFSLTDKQKSILAGVLSFLTVSAILFSYFWYTDLNFRNRVSGKSSSVASSVDDSNAQLAQTLKDLSDTLTRVAPEDYIYQTINFEELPVYPKAWVEKYYTSSERANALISGPSADADGDGLSNKQEYLLASDPKNKDTLCNGKTDTPKCTGKNDKQNIDQGISPLTGEPLLIPAQVRVKRQDYQVLNQVQDSFATAYREGVDFPSLYQLSGKINLDNEFDAIKVETVADERNAIVNYLQVRIDVLQEFVDDSEVSSFSKIYQIDNKADLDKAANRYYAIRDKLYTTKVPNKYLGIHKSYILLFQKLASLVLHRKTGLDLSKIDDVYKEQSKQKGVEVIWTYRKLNTELSKIPDINTQS